MTFTHTRSTVSASIWTLTLAATVAGCSERPRVVQGGTTTPAPVASETAPTGSSSTQGGVTGTPPPPPSPDPGPQVVTTQLSLPANLAHASIALEASGGQPPYAWRALNAVPQGLTLSGQGLLEGVPRVAGAYTLQVGLTDSAGRATPQAIALSVVEPVLTVVAGTGVPGVSGDLGPAVAASLSTPLGLAVDRRGNVYVAEYDTHRVRRIDPKGTITTVVGTGVRGFSGDGGPAVTAQLDRPWDVAVDPRDDSLYVNDRGNHRVRRVDAATGVITTVAGDGTTGRPVPGPATQTGLGSLLSSWIGVDSSGRLALTVVDRLYRVDAAGVLSAVTGTGQGRGPSGVPATQTNLATVMGMCVAPGGEIYVSEWVQVRKVDAQGVLREVIARDATGSLGQYAGDGGPALAARFDGADGVAVDRAGNVFVSDSRLDGARVRRVDAGTGRIDTVAGGPVPGLAGVGGLARDAQLAGRGPLAVDTRGNLLFCDRQAHRVVRIGTR